MNEAVAVKDAVETTPPPPKVEGLSQIDLNIASYEQVFSKCLEAADRLIEKHGLSRVDKIQLAVELFSRFYGDQGDVARAKAAGREQRETIKAVMGVVAGLKTGSFGVLQ